MSYHSPSWKSPALLVITLRSWLSGCPWLYESLFELCPAATCSCTILFALNLARNHGSTSHSTSHRPTWDGRFLCTFINSRALPSDELWLYGSLAEFYLAVQRRASREPLIIRRAGSSPLGKQYGNERWTVNLIPARITRRAGAFPSMELSFFRIFSELSKSRPKISTFEMFRVYRNFP